MIRQYNREIATRGRGTYEITREIRDLVAESGVDQGLCHIFVHHTSASLILSENADPDVRVDLERFMARLVPDGDRLFSHVAEGPDDMPAHIRSILTKSEVTIPIIRGRCGLGTWQGIFLWEHRSEPHRRRITISLLEG